MDFFFCSVTRERSKWNLNCILIVNCLTIKELMHKERTSECGGGCMGVSVSVCVCYVGVGQRLPWDQERVRPLSGEQGRVCDRLQWLVELSGQNLSDSAEAMDHFGLQLCNLSPTSHHITASHLQNCTIEPCAFLNGERLANYMFA